MRQDCQVRLIYFFPLLRKQLLGPTAARVPDRTLDVIRRLGSFATGTRMMRAISLTGRGRQGSRGITRSHPAALSLQREREGWGGEQGILME